MPRRDHWGELPSGLYPSPDVRRNCSPLIAGLSVTGRAQPFIASLSSNAVESQCSFWARGQIWRSAGFVISNCEREQ